MSLKKVKVEVNQPSGKWGCALYGFVILMALSVVLYLFEAIINFISANPAVFIIMMFAGSFIVLCVKTELPKAIDEGVKNFAKKLSEKGGVSGILKDWVYALLVVINAPAVWASKKAGFVSMDEYYNKYYVASRDGVPLDEIWNGPAPAEEKPDIPVSLPAPANDKPPVPVPEPTKPVPAEKPVETPVETVESVAEPVVEPVAESAPAPDPTEKFPPLVRYAYRLRIPAAELFTREDLEMFIAARLSKDEREKAIFFCYAVYCKVKDVPLGDPYESPVLDACVQFLSTRSERARKYLLNCNDFPRLSRPNVSSYAYHEALACLGLEKEV